MLEEQKPAEKERIEVFKEIGQLYLNATKPSGSIFQEIATKRGFRSFLRPFGIFRETLKNLEIDLENRENWMETERKLRSQGLMNSCSLRCFDFLSEVCSLDIVECYALSDENQASSDFLEIKGNSQANSHKEACENILKSHFSERLGMDLSSAKFNLWFLQGPEDKRNSIKKEESEGPRDPIFSPENSRDCFPGDLLGNSKRRDNQKKRKNQRANSPELSTEDFQTLKRVFPITHGIIKAEAMSGSSNKREAAPLPLASSIIETEEDRLPPRPKRRSIQRGFLNFELESSIARFQQIIEKKKTKKGKNKEIDPKKPSLSSFSTKKEQKTSKTDDFVFGRGAFKLNSLASFSKNKNKAFDDFSCGNPIILDQDSEDYSIPFDENRMRAGKTQREKVQQGMNQNSGVFGMKDSLKENKGDFKNKRRNFWDEKEASMDFKAPQEMGSQTHIQDKGFFFNQLVEKRAQPLTQSLIEKHLVSDGHGSLETLLEDRFQVVFKGLPSFLQETQSNSAQRKTRMNLESSGKMLSFKLATGHFKTMMFNGQIGDIFSSELLQGLKEKRIILPNQKEKESFRPFFVQFILRTCFPFPEASSSPLSSKLTNSPSVISVASFQDIKEWFVTLHLDWTNFVFMFLFHHFSSPKHPNDSSFFEIPKDTLAFLAGSIKLPSLSIQKTFFKEHYHVKSTPFSCFIHSGFQKIVPRAKWIRTCSPVCHIQLRPPGLRTRGSHVP